jgi:endonuclease/exonuclease/phosphatase family metal-dependent hydrolase
VEFTAVSWNLFHGRDFPPNPALFTSRSRLLRLEERDKSHAQVNRNLEGEFAQMLARAHWDVALLQECPPRFERALAGACNAEPHRVLTSRNSLGALRAIAARVNPDLLASAEGGSNLTLVRRLGPLGEIVERCELEIHSGRPERRAMAFTRTASGLCIANLHATSDQPALAAGDVLEAAEASTAWAEGAPLLFGGDLNLRPGEDPGVFDVLGERFGLRGSTGPRAIDHLLSRGTTVVSPPTPWPGGSRELHRPDGLALRLSDHAPVEARFETSSGPPAPAQE